MCVALRSWSMSPVLLLAMVAAVHSQHCDGSSDVSDLMQHSALAKEREVSWNEFMHTAKQSERESSMPVFMAKMGLDAALTMLMRQVHTVDKAAVMTYGQLNGLVADSSHKEAKAVLHQAVTPLKNLFREIAKQLEEGGVQTKMALGMVGLKDASKAYDTAVGKAKTVLESLSHACTALSGSQLQPSLAKCSKESTAFQHAYPKIMQTFLTSLGDNLLDSVADKHELQGYIHVKVPRVMKIVEAMCTKVQTVLAGSMKDLSKLKQS
ncbi:hypothetical protein AK812_SmicGene43813 [Symbiodinium microadriaticum]|uniref:Uncharacterized protein n=1 Tax=Symbiodinium microadriaticum TaxID=2951 RepID=A0A1Q9C031_SYMMI|nr:hypothetical protein AK812_SmicGene43813 [Symbiodinium microadriaticum]CAE7032000.1 unnamed protein product [Symbiodinium sp. KB8]